MNEKNFKPFDKVLVRYDSDGEWTCDFYSHYKEKTKLHSCVGGLFECCIPYEGNEALLGTTDAPQPKRWRANRGEWYYSIRLDKQVSVNGAMMELYNEIDNAYYNSGNYFRTQIEAEEMAVKFRALLVKSMLKGE